MYNYRQKQLESIKKFLDMINFPKKIYNKIQLEIRYRKKLKELRKKDPFIYK